LTFTLTCRKETGTHRQGWSKRDSRGREGDTETGGRERDTQTGRKEKRHVALQREGLKHATTTNGGGRKETRRIAERGTQTWNQSQMCVEKKRESDGEIEGGRRKSVRGGDSDMQRRRRRRRWWSRGKSSAELSAERGPGIRRRRLHVQFARTSQNV